MTEQADGAAMPTEIIESLEILMFEAIGMTAIALSRASAGELTLSQTMPADSELALPDLPGRPRSAPASRPGS